MSAKQYFHIPFIGPTSDAIFGDPRGTNKVSLGSIKQAQIKSVELTTCSVEKLARGLLLLLFSDQELATGNCTKPVRSDIN